MCVLKHAVLILIDIIIVHLGMKITRARGDLVNMCVLSADIHMYMYIRSYLVYLVHGTDMYM